MAGGVALLFAFLLLDFCLLCRGHCMPYFISAFAPHPSAFKLLSQREIVGLCRSDDTENIPLCEYFCVESED